MPTYDVKFTVLDNAQATPVAPPANTAVLIGCSSEGTPFQVVSTRSPSTLATTFGTGPLPEAAALVCQKGGTAICIKVPSATPGSQKAVAHSGTGSSTVTTTGNSNDDAYVVVLVTTGGTIGVSGCKFQVSYDAGRNYGPIISLGTAATYTLPGLGVTLNFGGGSLVAGDEYTFQAVAPQWAVGDIQTALAAVAASPLLAFGFGIGEIVGVCSGANAATIEGYLDSLALNNFVFSRFIVAARDAVAASMWSASTQETESAWMTSIEADFNANTTDRICVAGAYWNMPSAFPNAAAGTPRYRRSVAFAAAARKVAELPQRSLGRVKSGSISQIVVDPANDPIDGFVYHDESVNPGLTAARIMSTQTRRQLTGVFFQSDLLMSQPGSDFNILPKGTVFDIGLAIIHQVGQQEINDDIRTNTDGTIFETDAQTFERTLLGAINDEMTAAGMLSPGSTVTVNRTWDVLTNDSVQFTVRFQGKAYVFEVDATVGFANPNAA